MPAPRITGRSVVSHPSEPPDFSAAAPRPPHSTTLGRSPLILSLLIGCLLDANNALLAGARSARAGFAPQCRPEAVPLARSRRWSARTWRTTLRPGIPVTPPPPWVADPAW